MPTLRIAGLALAAAALLGLAIRSSESAAKPVVPTFKTAAAAARAGATRANWARYGIYRNSYDVGFKVTDWSVVKSKPYRYRSTRDPSRMHVQLRTREFSRPGVDYVQVAKADLWVQQVKVGPLKGRWAVLPAKPVRVQQGGYNADFQMP